MSNKTPRFRSVDPYSVIGGGPTVGEMIHLNKKTWIFVIFVRWFVKHRVASLILAIILATMIFESASLATVFTNLAAILTIALVILYTYTWYHYTYDPNFIRLTQAIRRRWLIHKRWPEAIQAAGFKTNRKLERVRYTPNGLIAHFKCDQGQHSEDLASSALDIAAVLHANEVKVDAHKPYLATVSIVWGDPTERVIYPEDIQSSTADVDKVTFALDSNHQPLELSLRTSMLIIGEPDSGKSNCFWSILNGLNEKAIPYKLWVIDPAGGVELDELENSPNTIEYVSRPSQVDALINKAHNAMETRLNSIKGKGRMYRPSKETPLNIIIVDEFLLLPRFEPHSPMGEILSSGRKAGFIVIGLSQLSQVDALGRTRDLFPQRICHATKSAELTDAALGSGAEAAGAQCSRIPKRTPGVGYYFSLQTRVYTRFRTPLITDENTGVIATGNIIQRTVTGEPITKRFTPKRRTSVYQYYGEYDGELGRLLYVGIAYDPQARWDQHADAQNEPWTKDVDPSLTEIEWYPTRTQAKARETELIQSEHPVYNKQERVDYDLTNH